MNRRKRTAVLTRTIAILGALLASSCATNGVIPNPADEIDISPPRRAAEIPSGEIPAPPADDALAAAPDAPAVDALAAAPDPPLPPADEGDSTLPAPAVAIRDDLPQHRAPSADAPDVVLAAPEPEPVAPSVAQPARAGRPPSTAAAPPAADPQVTTTPPADAGLPLPVAPAPAAAAVSVAAPARVDPSAREETPEPTRPATVVATVPVATAPAAAATVAPVAPASAPAGPVVTTAPAASRGDGGFTVGREGLDTLSVRFPGSGWVFVGNEHSSGDVTLVEKRRVDGDDVFVFRFGQPGEYHLWFQQQQPGGVFVNERVAVDTSAEPARSTADSARSTADSARPTADSARSTADSARSTADLAAPTADATAAGGRAVPAADDAPAPPAGDLSGSVAALPSVAVSHSTVSGGSSRSSLAGMSDTELFALAQRLERPGPNRDLRLALDVYELLVDNHPFSDAWDDGRARATYLRRHYFDIR